MGSRRFLALSRGPHLFAGVSGQKEELGCERDAPEIGSIPPASLPSMGVQKGGGPGPRIPTTPDPLPEPGGAERPDPGRQRGYKGLLLSSGTQNSGGARWGWAWAPRPCPFRASTSLPGKSPGPARPGGGRSVSQARTVPEPDMAGAKHGGCRGCTLPRDRGASPGPPRALRKGPEDTGCGLDPCSEARAPHGAAPRPQGVGLAPRCSSRRDPTVAWGRCAGGDPRAQHPATFHAHCSPWGRPRSVWIPNAPPLGCAPG